MEQKLEWARSNKNKGTIFVPSRKIWTQSGVPWYPTVNCQLKMIVKKEKKSTQYNQFKLHDHEQSAQKALVTSSSQSYAHSSHCVQEMRFIQNRVRCISNTLVALIRNLTISCWQGCAVCTASILQRYSITTLRPWHVKWKFSLMGDIPYPSNRWSCKMESHTKKEDMLSFGEILTTS